MRVRPSSGEAKVGGGRALERERQPLTGEFIARVGGERDDLGRNAVQSSRFIPACAGNA